MCNKSRCGGAGCGYEGTHAITGHDVFKSMVREFIPFPPDPCEGCGSGPEDCKGSKGCEKLNNDVRDYNVGNSDYATRKIQPWDIWKEYELNPWDADIVKRVLRNKEGESRELDYEKIKHICDERIRQIKESNG